MGETKSNLVKKSCTARLWFQYQNTIAVIRKLINADRIRNCHIHMDAIQQILPIITAAGYLNYTKSAYLHANVHDRFKPIKFLARRTLKYWLCLPCDLAIEQVLMRSLKIIEGLTRGADLSNVTRSIWLLSSPIFSQYK